MVFKIQNINTDGYHLKIEDLEIWQFAWQQANELYKIYTEGVFSKDYDLRNQLNASTGSVMDNIVEGFESTGNKKFINFLLIAKASNGEVRSQLYRATDRKYLTSEKFDELILKNKSISKKVTAFIKYLKESDKKGFRYE